MTTISNNDHPTRPTIHWVGDLVPNPFQSVDWISRRLNQGVVPGRKIGRRWYMTDDDIRAALEVFKNNTNSPSGITLASARLRTTA